MKRLFITLIILISISLHQFGQSGWFWLNPKPDGNTLNDVAIFGDGYAVAVGYMGLILRSTDNGETWSKIYSGTTSILWGVSMHENGTGWIVGVPGSVLKTTDNGLTWVKQATGNYYSYYAVFTSDGVNCMIGGYPGTVYTSNDGGTNWTTHPTNSTKTIRCLYSDGKGLIYTGHDGGVIQRSPDNGATWVTLPSPITTTINDIKFLDSLGIAVSTEGKILRTVDYGTTWTLITATKPYELNTICITDRNKVLIMGIAGYILNSTDGGTSFTATGAGFFYHPINAVVVKPNAFYLAVGNYGTITKSQDRLDWVLKTNGFVGIIYDIWFTDTLQGFAAGDYYGILKTIDGGATWKVKNQSVFYLEYSNLFFVSRTTGFAATSSNLFKTSDSGENWTKVFSASSVPVLYGYVQRIFFLNPKMGWIVTDQGSTYKTSDFGITWEYHPSGVTKVLTDVVFIDTLRGFITGWGGTILKTIDGGSSWTQISNSITQDMTSLHAFNMDSIIVCGFYGKVYRTSDGGLIWNSVSMPPSITYNNFRKIRFLNDSIGWLVGDQGALLKTKDGGKSWSLLPTHVGHDLFTFSFTDENHGWAAGLGGTIIKTIDGGGISSVETIVNKKTGFRLNQNYPNPFDQKTTLTYYLPKRSKVKLDIYNVLGSKMATILESEKDAGEHQVTFDGSGLPAGIYFCRYTWGGPQSYSIRLLKN
ncbi:MAG: YCF48-related protein [Bacteroidia bacterium]|nr:YCF48-related protein [Bacteroidia bacterium]